MYEPYNSLSMFLVLQGRGTYTASRPVLGRRSYAYEKGFLGRSTGMCENGQIGK